MRAYVQRVSKDEADQNRGTARSAPLRSACFRRCPRPQIPLFRSAKDQRTTRVYTNRVKGTRRFVSPFERDSDERPEFSIILSCTHAVSSTRTSEFEATSYGGHEEKVKFEIS